MKSLFRANKEYVILVAIILLAVLLYVVLGRGIIASVSASAADTDMLRQQRVVLADKVTFLVLGGAAVCFLLHRLTFGRKKTSLFWALLIFSGILVLVYKLNPNHRVYAQHGFLHAGIAYQILNGQIPPPNPLLAGQPLFYPWGYESIAAVITKICNISPFYSYAVINVVSLVACMLLIYGISRLLIKNRKANIFSVIIALFGATPFTSYMMLSLRQVASFAEPRGHPPFAKFSNINGVPLGLVFYLMFLYSLIKIFINQRPRYNIIIIFFLSLLGGGFVYPQFLPAVIAVTILFCLVNIVWKRKEILGLCVQKSTIVAVLLIISAVILYPYVSSLSSDLGGGIELFNVKSLFSNTVNCAVLCFPVLLVIFLSRQFIRKDINKDALIIVLMTIAATLACYLFIHLRLTNEYKFLMLAMMILGILGGISLSALKQRWRGSVIFILSLIFVYPAFSDVYTRLRHHASLPIVYVEKGSCLYPENAEQSELYEWIRNNTGIDDVFIDTKPDLSVYAQRCLFVSLDKKAKGRTLRYPGYGFTFGVLLQDLCGYGTDLIRKRSNIVFTIYGSNRNLTPQQRRELSASGNDVYVIVRKAVLKKGLNRQDFVEVFRSSRGNFLVYRFAVPSSQA
jgi:hypothetical protein